MPSRTEKKLSNTAIANAKSDKDLWLNDGGGLYLRVRPSEEKTFFFRNRHPRTGKLKWFRIGRYPDVTLSDARKRAGELRKLREEGISPHEHQADRLRAIDEERRNIVEAERQASMVVTVQGLFDEWFENRILPEFKKPNWIKNDVFGSVLTHTFKPDGKATLPFASIPAKDVDRSHIVNIIETTQKRGANALANDQLRYLERMFEYGITKGYLDISPYVRIEKRAIRKREQSRTRTLSTAELRIVLQTVGGMRASWQVQSVIQMSLYSAQRTGYVCQMEWAELHSGEWRIPPEKQAKEERRNTAPQTHTVYLPPQALVLLDTLRPISGHSRYVFVSDRKGRGDLPIMQATVEQAIGRHLHPMPGQGFRSDKIEAGDIKPYWDMPHWNAHDLRRTVATRMAEDVGIAPHIIEKILNHAPNNELAAIYNRATYTKERKEAARRWGTFLHSLCISQTTL